MTTGQQIIDNFDEVVNNQDPGLMQKVQVMAAKAQMQIFDLHARAIACYCECMGMQTEGGYESSAFDEVMQKWGLIDSHHNPLI